MLCLKERKAEKTPTKPSEAFVFFLTDAARLFRIEFPNVKKYSI